MDKKSLCLYFQVHQPIRLRQYHFFDIGKSHDYYDDFSNYTLTRRVADRCYLPMNNILLSLIGEYGKRFKVAFSISGMAVEQFRRYAPDVLESFKALVKTGCVEILSETYSHSLASLVDATEFKKQVKRHDDLMKEIFGVKPVTFRNTELVYSDTIGEMVEKMGFTTMLTEGAKHVLGWKSPNYVYTNAINPKLRLLLKNYTLSDDIAFRFSNREWDQWPLTADKYASWLSVAVKDSDVINLFMDYETFGEHQRGESGIFDFMRALPGAVFNTGMFEFVTPAEAATKHQPVAPLHVPFAISWADEERDITAWLGNELQNESFEELYKLKNRVTALKDADIQNDFDSLQASDHFYYMCTKLFADGGIHKYFSPYDTPYEAFINYMNVLSDLIVRINQREKELAKDGSVAKPDAKVSAKAGTKAATKSATKSKAVKAVAKETAVKSSAKATKTTATKSTKTASKSATKAKPATKAPAKPVKKATTKSKKETK